MLYFLYRGMIWKQIPPGNLSIIGVEIFIDGFQAHPCKVAMAEDLRNGKEFNYVSLAEKIIEVGKGWTTPVRSDDYCLFEAAFTLNPWLVIPYKDK